MSPHKFIASPTLISESVAFPFAYLRFLTKGMTKKGSAAAEKEILCVCVDGDRLRHACENDCSLGRTSRARVCRVACEETDRTHTCKCLYASNSLANDSSRVFEQSA
jgi:hypothetical protein